MKLDTSQFLLAQYKFPWKYNILLYTGQILLHSHGYLHHPLFLSCYGCFFGFNSLRARFLLVQCKNTFFFDVDETRNRSKSFKRFLNLFCFAVCRIVPPECPCRSFGFLWCGGTPITSKIAVIIVDSQFFVWLALAPKFMTQRCYVQSIGRSRT